MQASRRLRSVAHRLRLRDRVDAGIDRVRLAIDGTVEAYQPQDLLERNRLGARDQASRARWAAMEPLVREVGATSALDIGCNIGWFVSKLASLGIPVVGVEGRAATYRSALYARQRAGLDAVGILAMTVTPATVGVLPTTDCVLLMSVWHHMIDDHGTEDARELLSSIWGHTRKVLFFENGAADLTDRPELSGPETGTTKWYLDLLSSACPGGDVRHLGTHAAGAAERDLFAVVRSQQDIPPTAP